MSLFAIVGYWPCASMHHWPDTWSLISFSDLESLWLAWLTAVVWACWNKNKPKYRAAVSNFVTQTRLSVCPHTSDLLPLLNTHTLRVWKYTSHLVRTWNSSLLHHITVRSTQPLKPQCNTVCGRKKTDHLCDLITLWGILWYQSPHVCPTCDLVATCKHCYMWSEPTFHWLHFAFTVSVWKSWPWITGHLPTPPLH